MKVSKMTLLILLVVNIFISVYIANRIHGQIREKENSLLDLYTSRLLSAIESYAQNAKTLKVVLENHHGAISDESFEKLAAVMHDADVRQTIAFLPNGIVTQVYPYLEYKDTLGFNVFENENTREDSIRAKEMGELVVSGPFRVVHGGFGFVIRVPVIIDDEFIGFTAVSMELDPFLEKVGVTNLDDFGYQYRLTTMYEGGEKVAYKTEEFDESRAVSNAVYVENSTNTFTFELYVSNRLFQIASHVSFWFLTVLLITIIIYALLRRFEQNKFELIKKLQIDPLTGAYNRTRLYNYAATVTQDFVLIFIDLNKFKPVNDTYGHDVGDKLLIAYVQRLRSHMPSNASILRLGGDEFVVIVPDIIGDTVESIVKRIKVFSEEVFSIDDKNIYISASVGCVLSSEADTIEELLEIADQKMYYEKQKTNSLNTLNLVSHG